MTQLNEEHFELHDKNKDERYQRQKVKFLEDRIATLEKSLERVHKHISELIEIINKIQNKSK
tara:strand:+ start:1814 stop:1999 length:186 start_codon:yes stop_codon:yes gene_type:complete